MSLLNIKEAIKLGLYQMGKQTAIELYDNIIEASRNEADTWPIISDDNPVAIINAHCSEMFKDNILDRDEKTSPYVYYIKMNTKEKIKWFQDKKDYHDKQIKSYQDSLFYHMCEKQKFQSEINKLLIPKEKNLHRQKNSFLYQQFPYKKVKPFFYKN